MLPSGVLGVDLGTSHTVAALRGVDGSAAPLLFDGSPLLPSAVYAESDETLLVGRDAIHSARLRPERFEPNPKRRVDDGTVLLGDNEIDIARMFAAILTRVRTEAERVAGTMPARTVITHPAVWGPARRLVLTDACEHARLGDVTLVPEPVAAARYFATLPSIDVADGTAVVVYDFGGGTFDVSVVEATANGHTVLAVDGSDSLGGVDIDHALAGHIGQRFDDDARWATLMDPTDATGRRHRRTFLDDVRGAKERLSRQARVELLVPILDIDTHLTREELETVTGPLLSRAVRLTEAVIRASAVRPEQVAGVFLVGGSSRMPLAATTLHQRTGIAPTVIDQPELVVATGATMSIPAAAAPTLNPPIGHPISPIGPVSIPSPRSSPPYSTPPHMSPPVSSPPTHSMATSPTAGPFVGRTVMRVLHWVQFSLLSAMMLTVVVMATMYPNAELIIWILMPLLGGILPASGAISTAINAVRITNDPHRAHRSIQITQTLTICYLTALAILIEVTLTPEPVIRFHCAILLVVAAVILGLAQLSRPPDLAAHWRGPKQLRTTLGVQFSFMLVTAAVMLAWWVSLWTFDQNRGSSAVLETVAATATIATFALLALLATGLINADRLSTTLRKTLIAAQSGWLLVAALYMTRWLFVVDHRLMPNASGEAGTGRIALSDQQWPVNNAAEIFNITGLWFLVASAVPAILVIVQLATMPRNVTNPPYVTAHS